MSYKPSVLVSKARFRLSAFFHSSSMLSLLLHQTLNPATRVQAEQELETFKKSPQFIETLVRDCHDPLCQIYLKNHIKQYSKLSPQDCAIIKNNVISLLQNRSKMLLEIVSTILLNDTWPELDIFIGQIITTNTVLALELILEKAKLVQWKSDGCDSIIALLPALLPLKMDLACYKALLKIYNSTIRLNLSDYHKSSIHEWVSLFTKIIQLETASVDEKSVEWKAKKWAHNCISTLFRYTGRKNCSDFSTVYLTSCVPALMPVYFDQISRFVQGQYLSERSKQLTCAFLELCIKPKPTWPILQQHLEQVITHFIYPLLCFTEDDQDLWDSNPVEYIHKKIDPPMDDFRSPVTAAEELLTTLVTRKFKTCFVPTVQIINSILTSYNELDPSLRDPRKKYGAMKLMTCIADLALGTSSPIKGQLHIFMAQHIFSELHSSTDWLRAAACHSLLKFARINYPQPEQLEFAFQSVIQALHDDKLPVRVMAALALYPYFEYPQIVQGMKPHITSVMQKMLDLTNEIDMDTLTHVMEQLVFEFSAELTPFATQLAQQLVMTFMRIIKDGFLDKQNDDPDEAEEKIMAATGVLKTISSLCLSLDSSVSILLELEMVVTPCITIVLENSILDLFEECFEILETLTFVAKQISPTMWSMFPLIVSTFKADGRDYFEDMLPTLDNLISYGRDQIMANPAILSEFVDVIMIIMSSSPEERGESDFCRACQLMESIMLNLVSIDHVTVY